MSEKHYPYIGGGFDRIIFNGDGSVWVPESENAKLREQVVRWKSEWESERDYADQMETKEKKAVGENDKLRELVRKYGEYTSQDRCEGCVCKSRCNDGEVDECWQLTEIRALARELGIEDIDA